MNNMFFSATAFNQDISGWAERSGRDSTGMFKKATAMQTSNKPSWAQALIFLKLIKESSKLFICLNIKKEKDMMRKILLIALTFVMTTTMTSTVLASSGTTKMVTDHAGHRVEIPKNPQRIASLHTLSTTHMLWDLGAPLIGTATRIFKKENRPYIRSVEEVFEIKFQDTNLVNYGKKGRDLEKIKASKPDVIIGIHEHMKIYDKLSAIAPTIIMSQGAYNMFEVYRDLATWVNKKEVFDAKHKLYLKKLAQVKKKFSQNPNFQTIAYILPLKGKAMFEARKHYGALTRVAHDLGFKNIAFITKQFSKKDDVGGKLSAEYLPKINADWVFSTYNNQRGETADTVYDAFYDIAPSWKTFIPAYNKQQIIIFPRESSRPMSFKVMNKVLDQFAKYAK